MEAVFERVRGVSEVVSGYAGGSKASAVYQQVSAGTTGHAEAVKITYDPKVVSYAQLLTIYFSVAHDPTELNRQGLDRRVAQQKGVPTPDRHSGGSLAGVLFSRGLPSGLHRPQPLQSLRCGE